MKDICDKNMLIIQHSVSDNETYPPLIDRLQIIASIQIEQKA